jgi:hypothetical protein
VPTPAYQGDATMARIVFDVDIASGADQIVEALNTKEGI